MNKILLSILLCISMNAFSSNVVDSNGVIEDFDFTSVDDLLQLEKKGVKLAIFKQQSEAAISSAHLVLFNRWVQSGGVGYFAGNALNSSLTKKLNLIRPEYFGVLKESGERFSFKGGIGELFVRGVIPEVKIADHKLTQGVQILYVGAAYDDGVFGLHPIAGEHVPLLSLGPICKYDNGHYDSWLKIGSNPECSKSIAPIIVAVSDGKGVIVFDGTGLMLGKNSFEGNSYDFEKYYSNLLNYSGSN